MTVLGPDDAFGEFPEVAAQADGRIVASLAQDKRALLLDRVACRHRVEPFSGVFVSREDSVATVAQADTRRVAAVRYLWFEPGILDRLEGIDTVAREPDVECLQLTVRPGDRIDPVLHSFDRHGFLIVTGDDYAATAQRADLLRDRIRARVR